MFHCSTSFTWVNMTIWSLLVTHGYFCWLPEGFSLLVRKVM